MANKKIKNASSLVAEGITFRSKLEYNIFKILKEAKIRNLEYEKYKFVIWEGYKPTLPFFIKNKKTGLLQNDTKKIMSITYTPDFTFTYKEYFSIVEVKAFENDVFPYKKKLFRRFLEEKHKEDKNFLPVYCQIGSKREMLEFLQILQTLK